MGLVYVGYRYNGPIPAGTDLGSRYKKVPKSVIFVTFSGIAPRNDVIKKIPTVKICGVHPYTFKKKFGPKWRRVTENGP